MASDEDLLRFVKSSFPSIWTLELLLVLKRDRRWWSRGELITALRASDLVVSNALDSLLAAGLASVGAEGAMYMPANADIAAYVEQTEAFYAVRPDSLRRAIVRGPRRSASVFSDAFRLRRD